MSEMIERVARAIAEKTVLRLGVMHDEEGYEILARAAIAAMREPTAAMSDATEWRNLPTTDTTRIWVAMIDAALEP